MSVHSAACGTTKAPAPKGARASGDAGLSTGDRTKRARVGQAVLSQRQRIDMTSPATMAPKPMAKFQADNDTMSGMSGPAT